MKAWGEMTAQEMVAAARAELLAEQEERDARWDAGMTSTERATAIAEEIRRTKARETAGTLPDSWSDQMDLERALATLSPTARAVVWLYDVEGYSHEEIARHFGRSVSFSKSQLARAHARLREWYEPQTDGQSCAPT